MKKWMKTAAAAFIGAAICTAAGSLSASADVTPDGDTLILSGNVTVDEVQAYANNEAVKKVVCEPETVFPMSCEGMFLQFAAESIDLSNANTEEVTNMTAMFSQCQKLTELNITNFNTEKVKYMSSMFNRCKALENVDLSSFSTPNLSYVDHMFNYCEKLKVLDLSSFDMSNVNKYGSDYMFGYCSNLKTIYASEDWPYYSESKSLFWGCTSLVGGNGTTYNENNVNMEYARIDGKDGQPGYFTYSENYVKGASLTLNGKIGVNFYVSLNSKAHTVVVTDPVNETEYPVSQIDSFKQADGSYKIPGYVNSTQAGKAVTLKVLDEAGEQLDLYNSNFEKLDNGTVSYSVNDYIADTAQYSDDALVKDLVQKLDTYCKAAENYFCGTSHALDIPAVNITKTNNFNKQFKISLVLDSGTALRIYSDAASAKRMNGANEIILAKQQNAAGKQYYEISDIRAQYLLNDVTVVLDGVTYKVNPMDYCAMVFAKDGGDPNLTAVCAALYHYGAAAKAYAESIQN